ncbi:protein of unknown function DUF399 [[Leptolyngbya] sp. PCC 7376]|uniref:ChaN family lipoprotein n=1 Tax=[Leptolyngbya] sp. PCC 7376 TaxID=111781 RepID=UPI00029EF925|nr:ChaN family lipoprotein [[Leptolyngbya] sp. PCC 7376]AFY39822.1 protein of unknown function DUF399 [[Leptolyngbya] sp. PCC 7376]
MHCFFGLFLAFCLCWSPPVFAAEFTDSQTKILRALEQAPVIYLGEVHDYPEDHETEFELLKKLYINNQNLAVGFEMFQRPFQPYLSRYLADEITELELQELSEYDSRWGFDWEYYAPLLRFAKAHKIPLLALNTPSEITNKVAIEGLDSLERQDYRYIPAREDLDFSNEDYLAQIEESFRVHMENDYGNKAQNPDNFIAAQILWDETMAEAIADYLQAHQDQQFITFVGQAHIENNFGIPDRVARRIPDVNGLQKTVFLSSDNPVEDAEPADFVWNITTTE